MEWILNRRRALSAWVIPVVLVFGVVVPALDAGDQARGEHWESRDAGSPCQGHDHSICVQAGNSPLARGRAEALAGATGTVHRPWLDSGRLAPHPPRRRHTTTRAPPLL